MGFLLSFSIRTNTPFYNGILLKNGVMVAEKVLALTVLVFPVRVPCEQEALKTAITKQNG